MYTVDLVWKYSKKWIMRKFSTACLNRRKMNWWTEKKNLPRQQKEN